MTLLRTRTFIACLCAAFLGAAAPLRAGGKTAPNPALLAENFRLTRVAPRIFTPGEGPGQVNRVRFYFENPDNSEVAIRIFDVSGALVKRNLNSEAENVMSWDGSGQDGSPVKGGVYIYQIEAGRKILSGTVVVAR